MKKIFLIVLCMFLLSACGNDKSVAGNKEKNNKESLETNKGNLKENNIQEEGTKKENGIITHDISFKASKKYRDSIALKAVENGVYYFSYSTDSEWCYAKYCDGKMSDIYSLDNKYDIFYEDIINGNLVIGCFLNNKVTIMKVSMQGKEEIITEFNMPTLPIIAYTGNSLVWCEKELEDNLNKEKLMVYYFDTGKKEDTGIKCEYKKKGNYYTGDVVMALGGWQDGFCYTVTKFNNEYMYDDLSGETEIYYYSFKDKKSEKLTDYQYKPAYIGGSEEAVIVSDYILQGHEDTGKVLYSTEKGYETKLLDGVNAAENIYNSYSFKNNNYIAANDEYFWIFNTKGQTCQKYKFNHVYEGDFGKEGWKPSDHITSRIIKSGDKCYYSVYNNPLIEIYQINIENTESKKAWK